MNDCDKAGWMSAYHDGELPEGLRQQLEGHLRECPECAAELRRIRKLTLLLGSAMSTEMPEASLARLHRAADALPGEGVRRMASALAAVAAVVLAVCMVGLARQAPSQAAPAEMPVWETQAVAQRAEDPASTSSEELLASWVVQDLSPKDEL